MLRCAKRKHRRFWIALNCQQQISVKDGFDFEFQSRLHECDTKHAKGEDYPFVRSVYVCVPAFLLPEMPVTTEWPAEWDTILRWPLFRRVSETTPLMGQELHSGRPAENNRRYAAEKVSHTVTSRETVLTVSAQIDFESRLLFRDVNAP